MQNIPCWFAVLLDRITQPALKQKLPVRRQRISRHLRSLRVSNLHIVPWQNSLPWVGVGIFVS